MLNDFEITPFMTKLWTGQEHVLMKRMHKVSLRFVALITGLVIWTGINEAYVQRLSADCVLDL